jgi:transposase
MAPRFVSIDRDSPLLLPPNLRDRVPADHLVHFIVDAVAALDLRQVKVNERGTGSEPYPPTMLLALLIYSYATGTFGSRRIEQSTYDSVPVRRLTADTHPDHDPICTFRRENKALLTESFVQVLQLAVEQLVAKAEVADSAPLQDGLSIPAEITRRQERKAALEKARAEIEARAQARYAVELAEHEKKMAGRAARKERGERVGGKPPQAPTPEPDSGDQYNFTDPESRIMKAGNGNHFEQSCNAQGAVEVESRLIVGERASPAPNDKQELRADLQAIPSAAGNVEAVLIDSGFYSENAVRAVEQTTAGQPSGTTVYAAMERKSHHRSVADLERKAEPNPPAAGASVSEVMKPRLATAAGKQKYQLRQQTVEPVFGIIKRVLGFRRFLLRGLEKVELEWALVCTAYNLKRLHRLAGLKLAGAG